MKIIQALPLALILLSCGKKDTTIQADTVSTESAENIDTPNLTMVKLGSHQVKESSVSDIEQLVAKKSNDTLYVTNFFATWCGPCMREIPHFKEYKEKLKEQPVKFQFVSVDPKTDWSTEVSDFAVKNQLEKDIYLVDANAITPDFYSKNFQKWDGSGIPFTLFRKGDKKYEFFGMLTKEQLDTQLKEMMK